MNTQLNIQDRIPSRDELSLCRSAPVSETRPLVFYSSFIDWNATCEGQFPSVYCPLELNDYNAFPEGKAAWTVPVTSFYSQKVKAERVCVLRALLLLLLSHFSRV